MATAASAEAFLRPPLRGVDPQAIAARWSALALLAIIPPALLQSSILPNAVPFAALFCAAVATLVVRSPATPLRLDLVTPISVAFVAVGILYVGLSILELLPAGSQRPLRPNFVLRHSYYVFLWLPLMAGTTAMFRHILPDMARLAPRFALPALAALAAGDIAGAALMGDPERMQWEGYTSLFDPAILTILYTTCFLFRVATRRGVAWPLAVATVHCAVSNGAGYGMMFNTMTGMFVFVCMWSFALAWRFWSPRLALYSIMATAAALFAALIAGALLPEILGLDINTHWRFLIWRENMLAALESGLIGVGYGTPYYELSPGNIGEAFRWAEFSEFRPYLLSSPIDILYIRAQHSSFVNAFYRTGVLGGGMLIAFTAAMIALVVGAMRRGDPAFRPLVAAGGAIFVIEASQIAMHVGIESPRYFAAFALAVGLARGAAYLSRRGGDA
jgi:hypothetical protein